ncbi:putative type I restriction-modification system, S subunit [Phaeobacter inhibens]|uniref:restriction endonuclease subunit S n=1 Tax=Phaeobacter inhibens TaxID=221822 RepID=UPI000C9A862F|nr:restriction endonuclease subunit S [Phaeobacter inhibens]AUR03436.1 putative type I restriction-modification system, S subunit [Phaeobacter inhibens]
MNWPTVAISDVAEVVGGATPKSSVEEFWGGEIRWATPKDLSGLGTKYIGDTPRKITERGLKSCAASVLPSNSVLFSSRAPIGHVAINTEPMATNQGFKSFVPGPDLDSSFLYWWLDANRARLQALGTGATFKEVSKAVVKRIEIPLPPLEEQKRIAGILDQADALRRLRTRALDKLNTLGQAIFHEMFVRDPDQNWPSVLIDDIVSNARTGPFGSQLLVSEFVDEGIPVLGIDNVVQNKFAWAKERYITPKKYKDLERYTVLPGDVLITIMGTCGRCAVVPDDIPTAINTKHICCLTLDRERVSPEFLQAAFLNHPAILRQLGVQAKGAVMPGLNMGIIKGLSLQLPPMGLQNKYSELVSSSTKDLERQNCSLEKTEELFSSLQHRAFRGEL